MGQLAASFNFGQLAHPLLEITKILLDFMSRWMIPFEWAASSLLAI